MRSRYGRLRGPGWADTAALQALRSTPDAGPPTPPDARLLLPDSRRTVERRELLDSEGCPTGTISTTYLDPPLNQPPPASASPAYPWGALSSGFLDPAGDEPVTDLSQGAAAGSPWERLDAADRRQDERPS